MSLVTLKLVGPGKALTTLPCSPTVRTAVSSPSRNSHRSSIPGPDSDVISPPEASTSASLYYDPFERRLETGKHSVDRLERRLLHAIAFGSPSPAVRDSVSQEVANAAPYLKVAKRYSESEFHKAVQRAVRGVNRYLESGFKETRARDKSKKKVEVDDDIQKEWRMRWIERGSRNLYLHRRGAPELSRKHKLLDRERQRPLGIKAAVGSNIERAKALTVFAKPVSGFTQTSQRGFHSSSSASNLLHKRSTPLEFSAEAVRTSVSSRMEYSQAAVKAAVSRDRAKTSEEMDEYDRGRRKTAYPGDWVEFRSGGDPISGIFLGARGSTTSSMIISSDGSVSRQDSYHGATYLLPDFAPVELCNLCFKVLEENRLAVPATTTDLNNLEEVVSNSDDSVSLWNQQSQEVRNAAHNLAQMVRLLDAEIENTMQIFVNQGAREIYNLVIRLMQKPVAANNKHQTPYGSPVGKLTTSQACALMDPDFRKTIINMKKTEVLQAAESWESQQISKTDNSDSAVIRHVAMNRILSEDSAHFIALTNKDTRQGKFQIKAPSESHEDSLVSGWIRTRSKEFESFVSRAATFKLWGHMNQPSREANGKLVTREVPSNFVWSESDIKFINFLRRAVLTNQNLDIQKRAFDSLIPALVKGIQTAFASKKSTVDRKIIIQAPAPRLLDSDTIPGTAEAVYIGKVIQILADIGVTAPWENYVVHEQANLLMGWDNKDQDLAKIEKSLPTYGSKQIDSSDDIREDFSLPVYTIDDPEAFELDDGISVEPGRPHGQHSTNWVHVHIADPTSALSLDNPLSSEAATRFSSEYFPERNWGMLPRSWILKNGLSLGSQKGENKKTMTITMRITDAGEILESKIRLLNVLEVRNLTYEGVDNVLGVKASTGMVILKLRPHINMNTATEGRLLHDDFLQTSAVAQADMRQLLAIAKNLSRKRSQDGGIAWSQSSPKVKLSSNITHHVYNAPNPVFYANLPDVSLSVPMTASVAFSPANFLVTEFMIAANRAAAKFCSERNIIVPYRSQKGPPEEVRLYLESLKTQDSVYVNYADLLSRFVTLDPTVVSITPGTHYLLGIQDESGYTTITSPLRRYVDLVSHFQIKNYLLRQSHRESSSLRKSVTFSQQDMSRLIEHWETEFSVRKRLSFFADRFWAIWILDQKMKQLSGEGLDSDPAAAHVMENLTAIATDEMRKSILDKTANQTVFVRELGLRAKLRRPFNSIEVPPGEVIKVRISDALHMGRSGLDVVLRQ